jgi:hypothetical protein
MARSLNGHTSVALARDTLSAGDSNDDGGDAEFVKTNSPHPATRMTTTMAA